MHGPEDTFACVAGVAMASQPTSNTRGTNGLRIPLQNSHHRLIASAKVHAEKGLTQADIDEGWRVLKVNFKCK